METVYPVYLTYEECSSECGSIVSFCAGKVPHLVCQLNFLVFLIVIFFAIFTGIFIPLSCLFCWIHGVFRRTSKGQCNLFYFSKRNPAKSEITNDRSNFHSNAMTVPSTPPRKKPRQPSSFSLPAVSNDVILEEGEYDNAKQKMIIKSKRCRKITFDLSMTRRDHDFSQL